MVKITLDGDGLFFHGDVDFKIASQILVLLSTQDEKNEPIHVTKIKQVKRVSIKQESINPKIQELASVSFDDEYGNIYDLKTKNLQILWILSCALKQTVNTLSFKEIEYICKNLKLDISTKNITALNESNRKKGFTINKNNNLEITERGIEFLKNLVQK